MKILQDSLKPIYIQIAEGIEEDILKGILIENKQSYSQYKIAKQFSVNPATAAKGINVLVGEGILFKKRGLGTHVSEGAKRLIRNKRKEIFSSSLLHDFMLEAKKLDITKDEIIRMIIQFNEGLNMK